MNDRTKRIKTRAYYQMLVTCEGEDFLNKVQEEDAMPMAEKGKSQSKKCIYPARATRRKKNAKHKRHLLKTYLVMKKNEWCRAKKAESCKPEEMKPYARLEHMNKVVNKRKLVY